MRGFIPAQTDDEKVLVKRVTEAIHRVENGKQMWVSNFLDLRQQELALAVLQKYNWRNFIFDGGFSSAERKVLLLYKNNLPEAKAVFCVAIYFSKSNLFSHRDFLGALMSLGMKREVLGDILVNTDNAKVFATQTGKYAILQELTSVGRENVTTQEVSFLQDIVSGAPIETKNISVASLRLDAVLSVATNINRKKSAQMITSSAVAVNAKVVTNTSYILFEADILTIRGMGKFVLTSIGGNSKKNRKFITIEKY